ncbi:MAG TPA: putative Fe-S cluster assembly protein SufT [Terriglobales bacterium]|jgi:probable FeS assembly SUF system protein SufT|nr:putative Fe-S cluster assembly protein SufT [Terriglobales bacterium]
MLQEKDKLITLSRAIEVVEIPSGAPGALAEGTPVRIMQSLGGSYTVTSERGYMYRVDARDVDALGLSSEATAAQESAASAGNFSEDMVREQLRSVYDPEIPVNIVDLGLIYSCVITPLPDGKKIDVKMSMTAPGCGMGNVLKAEVESKLSRLPEVKEVQVEVVFDPPWHAGLMSEAARLQLGFDLDSGGPQSGLPVYR